MVERNEDELIINDNFKEYLDNTTFNSIVCQSIPIVFVEKLFINNPLVFFGYEKPLNLFCFEKVLEITASESNLKGIIVKRELKKYNPSIFDLEKLIKLKVSKFEVEKFEESLNTTLENICLNNLMIKNQIKSNKLVTDKLKKPVNPSTNLEIQKVQNSDNSNKYIGSESRRFRSSAYKDPSESSSFHRSSKCNQNINVDEGKLF